MASPRELYKSWHPDHFSDSEQREVTEVDRSLLEFQLGTLTGKSQEADFERFARRLCERETCPNLLPTTGPTGGGDSKADTETFPVADQLALNWFNGEARSAASERWAFAFSAKKDWLPKVRSDIAKIVETKRGYTKAFFVTNQAVPAKKRSQVEDELGEQHGIDVRILDRNWILERLFAGRHEDLAIEELKITGLSRDTFQVGPMDSNRLLEIEEVEKRIAEGLRSGDWGHALVEDALEVANTYRSLEKPRTEVEGSYLRANRFAVERGTIRQQVESAYQWAWTLFWWFEDIPAAFEQYRVIEDRAKESENVYDLERLSNLLVILCTEAATSGDQDMLKRAEEMRTTLTASLERLMRDEERPSTSLQAQTISLRIKIMSSLQEGEIPDSIMQELRLVIGEAEGLIGFPLKPLVEIIQQLGTVVSDTPEYDELLNAIIDIASKREGEIRAARMLLQRGKQLLDKNLPAKSIAMVGQALGRLYKHETRKDIVAALFACGRAYERVGLLWAARGVYLSGASIAVNEYWRYGEVTSALVLCAEALRRVELLLGRLPQLLAWHEFYLVVREALSNNRLQERLKEKEDDLFETLLIRLLIRTSPDDLPQLERLPDVLDRMQLWGAAGALLFLLGYPERMQEIVGDDDIESFVNTAWNLEADIPLPEAPITYEGEQVNLVTKIIGCLVEVDSSTAQPCVEIAESILASIESLLATSVIARAMPLAPELTIEVNLDHKMEDLMQADLGEQMGRPHMVVRCKPFNPYDVPLSAQAELRQTISAAAIDLLANIVMFPNMEDDLKNLFEGERVMDRASAFTSSMDTTRNVHGKTPKLRLSSWLSSSLKSYPLTRPEPWLPIASEKVTTKAEPASPLQPGEGDPPPGLFDADKIAHHEIGVVSPIRVRLWERADWKGAMYMTDPYFRMPPAMGLIFENEGAGRQIFEAWLSEIGRVDEMRLLRVTVVRGINRNKPLSYRVVMGGNVPSSFGETKILAMLSQMMTMEPTRPGNLETFLQAFSIHKRFDLMPAYIKNGVPEPDEAHAIELHELQVRDAWEIGQNDMDCAGVLPDDNVVIPANIKEPPVLKLLEWKQGRRSAGR